MSHVVVKEVTQPVHAADGSVAYRPGEQFPEETTLPEGVPWRLVVAEAPPARAAEKPAAAPATSGTAPRAGKAAAKGSAPRGG